MGRGVTGVFIALTMVSWVTIARLVRGEVLRIKEYPFILAAKALGASHFRIMLREIFPNILGILVVTLSFRIPVAILAESTLSFIGLGIAPPASSWGTLASDGWTAIKFYPHLILFPSLAIFFTILWSAGTRERKPGSISKSGIFHRRNIVKRIIDAMMDRG